MKSNKAYNCVMTLAAYLRNRDRCVSDQGGANVPTILGPERSDRHISRIYTRSLTRQGEGVSSSIGCGTRVCGYFCGSVVTFTINYYCIWSNSLNVLILKKYFFLIVHKMTIKVNRFCQIWGWTSARNMITPEMELPHIVVIFQDP